MTENRDDTVRNSVLREIETLPATFLRVNTRDVLERVKFGGERFLIKTFGRPMVVLISYEDYLSICELLSSCAANLRAPVTASHASSNTDGSAKTSKTGPNADPVSDSLSQDA